MGQLREDSAPWLATAPPLPLNGPGTGALEPGLPGTAVGNNRVSGERRARREQEAESREPQRGSANSSNSEARKELHSVLQLAPTGSAFRNAAAAGKSRAEARLSSGRQQQEPVAVARGECMCSASGSPAWGQRRPQGWQRTEPPKARHGVRPAPGCQEPVPRLLPEAVLAP